MKKVTTTILTREEYEQIKYQFMNNIELCTNVNCCGIECDDCPFNADGKDKMLVDALDMMLAKKGVTISND